MKKYILAGFVVASMTTAAPLVLGQDEEQCLECHEPAEDWEGMSAEEIFTDARAPGNKRHKDNEALSDEQLKAMITTMTK